MTFDLYGHLFSGARNEARARMDAYLEDVLADEPDPSLGKTMGK
jgi:hypothetical protein